jgi:hypothetical protein
MSYNPIINKLKDLRQIQPDSEWLRVTRAKLIEEAGFFISQKSIPSRPFFSLFIPSHPIFKPILVTLLILAMVFGGGATIQIAKTSLPGNFLYPVKRATEMARLYLTTGQSRVGFRTELVIKRLKEIEKLGYGANEAKLAQARQNFHQELINLQKEIVARDPALGSLPVQDGRQVIAFGEAEELERILEETKICLEEGDYKMALFKTLEIEELTKVPVESEGEAQPPVEESPQIEGSLSESFKLSPEINNPDFTTDLIKE